MGLLSRAGRAGSRPARARIRLRADLLFIAAFVVFALAALSGKDNLWVQAIVATAEAAMVGAAADWFAVNALFRRPLGIPWHTEIIPRNKAALGRSLGRFVALNFFSRRALYRKLRERDAAAEVAAWLLVPANRALVVGEGMPVLAALVGLADEDLIAAYIREGFPAGGAEAAPDALATLIELTVAAGGHQSAIDDAIAWTREALAGDREGLLRAVRARRPRLVPPLLDRWVAGEIARLLDGYLGAVAADQAHELRTRLAEAARGFSKTLRTDSAARDRVRGAARDLLLRPDLARLVRELKNALAREIDAARGAPDGGLRATADRLVEGAAERLARDEGLRLGLNRYLLRLAIGVSDRYRERLGEYIAGRVEDWGAVEITRKLEDEVGADLQYIRINGTVIGGAVGLALFALRLLLSR